MDIRLETEATVEVVLAESPDAVIVATGATARRPPIENMEDVRFVSAWDVLRDEHDIGNVVVIDENYGHQVRALPNIFWTAAKKSISSRSRRRLGPFSEPPRDHHS